MAERLVLDPYFKNEQITHNVTKFSQNPSPEEDKLTYLNVNFGI